MAIQVSHVGLCVSDLDRSLRFYTEGLGFEVQEQIPGDDSFAALAEVEPPAALIAQFIAKDGIRLELLAWSVPGVQGEPSQTRNQVGLTHLALNVDDVDEVAARLVSLGATVIEETSTQFSGGIKLLVVKDPDGTRVELVQGL
jgi:catechol 2,3-dioxygenase-like lactoylglutathione lyase family enzyme